MFGLAATGLLVLLAAIAIAAALAQRDYLNRVRSQNAPTQKTFFRDVLENPAGIFATGARRVSSSIEAYESRQPNVAAEHARRRANSLMVVFVLCLLVGVVGLILVAGK